MNISSVSRHLIHRTPLGCVLLRVNPSPSALPILVLPPLFKYFLIPPIRRVPSFELILIFTVCLIDLKGCWVVRIAASIYYIKHPRELKLFCTVLLSDERQSKKEERKGPLLLIFDKKTLLLGEPESRPIFLDTYMELANKKPSSSIQDTIGLIEAAIKKCSIWRHPSQRSNHLF